MSRLPSTSRRSGKNKLNRHLDHRRKTRVQLIRQHKSCNLSLPSAQVANELPGGLPERFHWPFLGSAQHHATNVSPSVCRSDPPAEPFVRVYDPWHELKFFLLLLPRNCWLTSHQVQAASTSTCSIFISKKNKQTVDRTNPSWYFLWVTQPTLKYQLKPTEAVFSAPGVVIPGPLVPTGLVTEPSTAFRASLRTLR